MTPEQTLILFVAALAAGAINSLAGGGTILSFPALVAYGLPPVEANATSMVALWPGSLGGAWGFRREIRAIGSARWVSLGLVSLVGGLVGAFLLNSLPSRFFESIASWLILGATILIAFDPWIRRRFSASRPAHPGAGLGLSGLFSVYGGYFGAGVGILLLPAFSLLGVRDIHEANGLKNLFMTVNKGIAAGFFIVAGLVDWRSAIVMLIGALVGGYSAAAIGRHVPDRIMRTAIVAVGVLMFLSMLFGS